MDGKPNPADGNDGREGAPDGVNQTDQRSGGGESGGGGYANPQSGKSGDQSGFMGHGGQADIDYRGSGQTGGGDAPNAATGSSGDADAPPSDDTPDRNLRTATADGRTVTVEDESGVTAAEATGNVDSPNASDANEEAGSG